jgi:Zn ribbon nucleic-acid-binding protein
MTKSKSIYKQRREAGCVCSVCKSTDYKSIEVEAGLKPEFKCCSCGHRWCYGKTGGKYAELLKTK